MNGTKIECFGDKRCFITKNGKNIIINDLKGAVVNTSIPSVEFQLVTSDKYQRTKAFESVIYGYDSYQMNHKFFEEAFKKLLNTDIDFNYTDGSGNFLNKLATSAKKSPLKCTWEIEELAKKGVDPNQKMTTFDNRTALLEYLFQNENIKLEIVDAFLKAGSKVTLKDIEGNDALDLAKKAPKEVKELLKEYKNKEK